MEEGRGEVGSEGRTGRTVALVVIAFLALVALLLWWQSLERSGSEELREVTVTPTEIEGEDRHILIGSSKPGSEAEREQVRLEEMRRALAELGESAEASVRRSAAIRLRYLADRSAERALVRLLNDDDAVVALRCADVLVALWQQSDSPRVNQFFQQALTAYERGDYPRALESLDTCASLDPQIPDLYRLRAESLLETDRPGEALDECRHALRLRDQNFLAHYALARCYLAMHDGQMALDSVNAALAVYGGFEAAQQLEEEILSLQRAGEL